MPESEQRARYDAEVAFVDHEIGGLMADVARRGLYEDTIVAVTADHGEAFGERGTMRHAGAPHLEQARVPLVIRLPRPARPRVRIVEAVVSLADVAPTLLELAGLPPLPAAEGRSLVPLWRGRRLPERFVYSQGGGGLAVRGARWTWLRLADGTIEIYDRARDPAERVTVHWPCTGDCARLAGAGERYLRLARRVRPSGRPTEPLTAEDLEELRALGYL
jgi:arylsulfatase A-like enzyme